MSTTSSIEAFAALKHDTLDYEIADTLRLLGPMGNEMLADLLGRTQGTISGALARLRRLGVVRDSLHTTERRSGNNEAVWELGDDSVEWLDERILQARELAAELVVARDVAQWRRDNAGE